MASVDTMSPAGIEAVALTDTEAAPGAEAASPSGKGGTVRVVALLLALLSVAAFGYTQWWLPRQEAEHIAQVQFIRCLDEVKVYLGKDSYADRLSQCGNVSTP